MTARGSIIVVGAGFAGLAAASRLARQGVPVQVLEREPHVGGRAAALAHDGIRLDPTGASVSPRDARLHELAHQAELQDLLLPLGVPARAQVRGGAIAPILPEAGRLLPRPLGIGALEALRLLRLPRLVRRFAALLDPERPERAAGLDDRSLGDFGSLYFGTNVVTRWMEPWLAERCPDDERETSRVAFLLRRAAEGDLPPGQSRVPVGRLAESLADGLDVRLGWAVETLEPRSGGGFTVGARGPAGRERVGADAVVLAVPSAEALGVAASVLLRAERELLAGVRYAAALTWTFVTRTALLGAATRVRVPRAEGGRLAVLTLDAPAPAGGSPAARLSTVVARDAWSRARLDAPDEAIAKEIAQEAERWLPQLRGQPFPAAWVRRFPRAYPRFEVGRYRALARLRALEREGRRSGRRLYLAGDFLVAPTLEGAVVSGLRAARAACADLTGG